MHFLNWHKDFGKRLLLLFSLFVSTYGFSQNKVDYLQANSASIESDGAFQSVLSGTDIENASIYFFGSVHGSQATQKIDFELLEYLVRNEKVKFYAPEVDQTLASMLNEFLETGNDSILTYVTYHYQNRVPQDASVEFMEKWRKIRQFNLSLDADERIEIIGTDRLTKSNELRLKSITLLDYKTGIDPLIDSLRFFRSFKILESPAIHSGKPIMMSGKPFSYYFPNPSDGFFTRLKKKYIESPSTFKTAFGENAETLDQLLNFEDPLDRESAIFENFKKYVIPRLSNGKKVYANFGYFHVQQGLVNGAVPIASRLKEVASVISILGVMNNSECLVAPKYKKTGKKLQVKGLVLEEAEYAGEITAGRSMDGDGLFEKLKGIKYLIRVAKKVDSDTMIFKLNVENSPYVLSQDLSAFQTLRGKGNWRIQPNSNTTDYFQYVILMRNSEANTSIQHFLNAK